MHITIEQLTINVAGAQDDAQAAIERAMHPESAAAPIASPAGTQTPPRIGAHWPEQGGVYAGVMRGVEGGPDYHLIVHSGPDGEALAWGGYGEREPGATDDWDGLKNTLALLSSAHDHPAAKFASELEAAAHKDFYLPSRRELRLCWVNVPELFDTSRWYWSSTQYSATSAWGQHFDGGRQGGNGKSYEGRARAVRRLLIP